jgi:hypothetical protein
VRALDLAAGAGGRAGAPREPFDFVQENMQGVNPKVNVTDATGRLWSIKFGEEVKAENFATRLVWACGYIVEPTYFVARGRILHVAKLQRAAAFIDAEGNFRDARFQLWDTEYKFLTTDNWAWADNPFLGTRELNGLKILMILLSNWDSTDGSRPALGPNTGILEHAGAGGKEWLYFVTDWGAAMGRSGRFYTTSKWDCGGFREQTPQFITGVRDEIVEWGYIGKHPEVKEGISLSDVEWLLRYLGRISPKQIGEALRASGATPEEIQCFAASIRARIGMLKAAVRHPASSIERTRSRLFAPAKSRQPAASTGQIPAIRIAGPNCFSGPRISPVISGAAAPATCDSVFR